MYVKFRPLTQHGHRPRDEVGVPSDPHDAHDEGQGPPLLARHRRRDGHGQQELHREAVEPPGLVHELLVAGVGPQRFLFFFFHCWR